MTSSSDNPYAPTMQVSQPHDQPLGLEPGVEYRFSGIVDQAMVEAVFRDPDLRLGAALLLALPFGTFVVVSLLTATTWDGWARAAAGISIYAFLVLIIAWRARGTSAARSAMINWPMLIGPWEGVVNEAGWTIRLSGAELTIAWTRGTRCHLRRDGLVIDPIKFPVSWDLFGNEAANVRETLRGVDQRLERLERRHISWAWPLLPVPREPDAGTFLRYGGEVPEALHSGRRGNLLGWLVVLAVFGIAIYKFGANIGVMIAIIPFSHFINYIARRLNPRKAERVEGWIAPQGFAAANARAALRVRGEASGCMEETSERVMLRPRVYSLGDLHREWFATEDDWQQALRWVHAWREG